jgi:hypothetical protein
MAGQQEGKKVVGTWIGGVLFPIAREGGCVDPLTGVVKLTSTSNGEFVESRLIKRSSRSLVEEFGQIRESFKPLTDGDDWSTVTIYEDREDPRAMKIKYYPEGGGPWDGKELMMVSEDKEEARFIKEEAGKLRVENYLGSNLDKKKTAEVLQKTIEVIEEAKEIEVLWNGGGEVNRRYLLSWPLNPEDLVRKKFVIEGEPAKIIWEASRRLDNILGDMSGTVYFYTVDIFGKNLLYSLDSESGTRVFNIRTGSGGGFGYYFIDNKGGKISAGNSIGADTDLTASDAVKLLTATGGVTVHIFQNEKFYRYDWRPVKLGENNVL